MGFLFCISMYPLENSLTKKGWTRYWGTSTTSCTTAFPESLPPWGSLYCLRSDSGQLWPTPRNLIFPFPFQSCLLNSDSSTGGLQEQVIQAGLLVSPSTLPWTPDVELEPGNVTLPSFFTRPRESFWKIRTQGLAISLRSPVTLSGCFSLSLALEIDF